MREYGYWDGHQRQPSTVKDRKKKEKQRTQQAGYIYIHTYMVQN